MGGPRYARRVGFRIKQEKLEDFLSEMRERIIPKVKQQAGIRRIYLLRSVGDLASDFASLTLWDSQDAADEYERSGAYNEIVESLREYLDSDTNLTQFDVALHDVNAEDLPPPESVMEKAGRVSTKSKRASPKKKGKKKKGSKRNSR